MAVRLGEAARQMRKQHGFRLIDVATEAGVSESTIHYFERGTAWRRETDTIVRAYATLADVTPDELWYRALALPDLEH